MQLETPLNGQSVAPQRVGQDDSWRLLREALRPADGPLHSGQLVHVPGCTGLGGRKAGRQWWRFQWQGMGAELRGMQRASEPAPAYNIHRLMRPHPTGRGGCIDAPATKLPNAGHARQSRSPSSYSKCLAMSYTPAIATRRQGMRGSLCAASSSAESMAAAAPVASACCP